MSLFKKEKSNKLLGILLPVSVLVILIVCFFLSTGVGNEAKVISINLEEYYELLKSEEPVYILFTRTSCSHCTAFKPRINKRANKYDFKVYDLNIENEVKTSEEFTKLHGSLPSVDNMVDENGDAVFGTPHSVIVQKGKELAFLEGNASDSELDKFLKDNNFIKE